MRAANALYSSKMDRNTTRSLASYFKGDDSLAEEGRLVGVELDALRDLFGIAGDNPMYDVYPVGPSQAADLQRFVSRPIDLERYDYFVQCRAESPTLHP